MFCCFFYNLDLHYQDIHISSLENCCCNFRSFLHSPCTSRQYNTIISSHIYRSMRKNLGDSRQSKINIHKKVLLAIFAYRYCNVMEPKSFYWHWNPIFNALPGVNASSNVQTRLLSSIYIIWMVISVTLMLRLFLTDEATWYFTAFWHFYYF